MGASPDNWFSEARRTILYSFTGLRRLLSALLMENQALTSSRSFENSPGARKGGIE